MEGVFGTCLVNWEANCRCAAITIASNGRDPQFIVYELIPQKMPCNSRSPLLSTQTQTEPNEVNGIQRSLSTGLSRKFWPLYWKQTPYFTVERLLENSILLLTPTFFKIALPSSNHFPARKNPKKISEVELGREYGEENLADRMHVEFELLIHSWTTCQGNCKHFRENILLLTKSL